MVQLSGEQKMITKIKRMLSYYRETSGFNPTLKTINFLMKNINIKIFYSIYCHFIYYDQVYQIK